MRLRLRRLLHRHKYDELPGSCLRKCGALDKLEAFASLNGPAWYGLPVNEDTITLVKRNEPVTYPAKIETGLVR